MDVHSPPGLGDPPPCRRGEALSRRGERLLSSLPTRGLEMPNEHVWDVFRSRDKSLDRASHLCNAPDTLSS